MRRTAPRRARWPRGAGHARERGQWGLALCLCLCAACADADPPAGASSEEVPDASGGSAPPARLRFRDVTAEAGVDFVHDAGFTPAKHLPEAMGHGGALIDLDADGDLDLYLVQGGPLVARAGADLPVNRTFSNRGDGRFADATGDSGDGADDGYGMGVVAGDVDGDGLPDLYVTNFGGDVLLRGSSSLRMQDVTSAAGIGDARWTTGACFFDAENDGDLDLYVTGYVQVDLDDPEWCGRRDPAWRTVCHPDRYPGLQDRYWRNAGDGSFADATEAAGVSDSWGKGLGVIAVDVDFDGFQDLYVANDSVENRLWHNRGDGTFVDETLLSGTGVNRYGATEAGMGLAAGDIDGDGDTDLFVTNFDHESHTVYRNDGELLFTDVTALAGIDGATRLPVGFGALMQDFDHDGDLDLAVANGHIVDRIALYDEAQTWRQRAQLFLNRGAGRFDDAGATAGDLCAEPLVGRGLYSGDVDGDGDLDLVLTECGGPTRVLRNELSAAAGGALVVAGLPRGARATCELADGRTLVRLVGPQPSYAGQTSPELHVGLGTSELVRLRLLVGPGDEREVELGGPRGPGRLRAVRDGERWRLREIP